MILVGNQVAKLGFCLFIQTCFFAQALEKIGVTKADLKFGKTGRQYGINGQSHNFSVCRHPAVADKFCTDLGSLF